MFATRAQTSVTKFVLNVSSDTMSATASQVIGLDILLTIYPNRMNETCTSAMVETLEDALGLCAVMVVWKL